MLYKYLPTAHDRKVQGMSRLALALKGAGSVYNGAGIGLKLYQMKNSPAQN
ncbi:hypothetical protein IV493_13110 [Pantoea sp. SM3640]|uniref:hypothetical protein n=1 Tax=Pantoea sp. SM3640 TaxID=2787629 RepID=UPI0018A70AA0|nr:hypothetical protein [Pantoea sp. SM3640]QPG26283.1 hypothetical protein IV493_13110 [Pantoea sp. SM3640]